MRWERLRRSQNVEDRRGQQMTRRPAAAGGGCGLVLLLIIALAFKITPLELLSQHEGLSLLEEGDIQEAMRAAQAIGDDALQGGRIRPDSFTHGTSAQTTTSSS